MKTPVGYWIVDITYAGTAWRSERDAVTGMITDGIDLAQEPDDARALRALLDSGWLGASEDAAREEYLRLHALEDSEDCPEVSEITTDDIASARAVALSLTD